MAVVGGMGLNGRALYSNVVKPIEVNVQFTVTPTNGAGVSSLKSNGYVQSVYMHSSSPSAANPNPANGFAMIQLKQNFNAFLNAHWEVLAPNSGSDVKIDNSAMTAGQLYTITTLGNATAAKWTAIGVPAGVTPAVGVSFIALTNGGAGNTLTSKVQVPSVTGINAIEIVGTPSVNINTAVGTNGGQIIYAQFLAPTSSSVTTAIATAPLTGSIVCLKMYFDGSSVTVDGL